MLPPGSKLRKSVFARWRQVRRRRDLLRIALLTLLVGLQPAAGGSEGENVFERVGQGDPRTGYESSEFETRSMSLAAFPGVPFDLAALAAKPPLGLPPLPDPPDAPLITLGRQLFFDRRLSANETLSCGMCHVPEQAFTQNELATPVGIEGRFVRRNAPALYNVGYRRILFHDGRESSLEAQIWAPLLAPNEMGNTSKQAVLERIEDIPGYRQAFDAQFPDGLTAANLGRALAGYQRTLLSADSPFDRWYFGGDQNALPAAAKRGFFQFNESGCANCHRFGRNHAHFTDDGLHRTGVEYLSRQREASGPDRLQVAPGVIIPVTTAIPPPDRADEGRFEVTGDPSDRFRYRTPSLRNVALTAPYMHDGSLTSLDAVLDFYTGELGVDPEADIGLVPAFSATQRSDLLAFLESLTGANVDRIAADARTAPIGERGSAPDAADEQPGRESPK